MDNVKEIDKALRDDKTGLSITNLVSKTSLSRGQIRTALAFLLGAGLITEKPIGMAKVYFIKK